MTSRAGGIILAKFGGGIVEVGDLSRPEVASMAGLYRFASFQLEDS